MTPRKYVNWQNQIEQIWLNEIIEYQFMKKRKFPYVRLITWIQIRFYKRISRIIEAILRFPTWFAVNEKKKHVKFNNANWFAFVFIWFQMKLILRFPLHLFWRENSWNWILRLYFLCIWFVGKIREIEYRNMVFF